MIKNYDDFSEEYNVNESRDSKNYENSYSDILGRNLPDLIKSKINLDIYKMPPYKLISSLDSKNLDFYNNKTNDYDYTGIIVHFFTNDNLDYKEFMIKAKEIEKFIEPFNVVCMEFHNDGSKDLNIVFKIDDNLRRLNTSLKTNKKFNL